MQCSGDSGEEGCEFFQEDSMVDFCGWGNAVVLGDQRSERMIKKCIVSDYSAWSQCQNGQGYIWLWKLCKTWMVGDVTADMEGSHTL